MRLTKQERLQAAWDETGEFFEGVIEFRPRKGWYAEPTERRHFNDEGEYLGWDYQEALDYIRKLQRKR